MTIHAVDLFCGLGGLTHGLAKGGVRIAAGIDIDDQCRFAYEANNKAKFINADVRSIAGETLRQYWRSGAYSLLAGCAPCQPFSTYSRKGRSRRQDTKWDLVADFGRLVQSSMPDFVTMENVPQLRDHEIFGQFLKQLTGYDVWHNVIQCERYGVPQTRKRLVLLASRHAPVTLLEPAGALARATVRATISHLGPLRAGETDPSDPLHSACSLSHLNLRRIRASVPGGSWRDWPLDLVANCHRGKPGETYPSVYGRMEWDGPAPTITTQCFGYGNGRFGHPEQDRAITLREAAMLQTFPESYRFLRKGEKARYSVVGRLIGNAVPVNLGEVIAATFVAHARSLGPTPTRTSRSNTAG